MKSRITNIIQNYLDEKESDYALLLNGEWGSGKTYFVRNVLSNLIKDWKIIYISVFGIETVEELKEQILSQGTNGAADIFNFIYSNSSGLIKKNIGFDLEKSLPLRKIKSSQLKQKELFFKSLFVFDDLERINKDFLVKLEGFLSIYFLNNNYKVLLVGNKNAKKQIEKLENKDDLTELYLNEKIIGREINFQYQNNEIPKEIANNFEYLREFPEIINKIQSHEITNLRTIKFVNYIINEVFRQIDCEDEVIVEQIINFSIIFSLEWKNGNVTFINSSFLTGSKLENYNLNAHSIFSESSKKEFTIDSFNQKYSYNFFNSIFQFITAGYLDGLQNELEYLQDRRNKSTIFEIKYNFNNFRPSEYKNKLEVIYNEFTKKDLNLFELIDLFIFYISKSKELNILSENKKNNLLDYLKTRIDGSDLTEKIDFFDQIQFDNVYYRDVLNSSYVKYNKELALWAKNEFIKRLESDKTYSFNDLTKISFFDYLSQNEFVNLLKDISNSKLQYLVEFVKRKEFFLAEKNIVEKVITSLEKNIEDSFNKENMRRFFNELKMGLKGIVESNNTENTK